MDQGCFVDFPLAWFSDDATVIFCSERGVVNTHETLFCFRNSTVNLSNVRTTDRIVAKKKIIACCQFYDWIKNYSIWHRASKDENVLLRNIKIAYQKRVYDLILDYFHLLDVRPFWKLMKWLKYNGIERNFFKRLLLLIKWLKHKWL